MSRDSNVNNIIPKSLQYGMDNRAPSVTSSPSTHDFLVLYDKNINDSITILAYRNNSSTKMLRSKQDPCLQLHNTNTIYVENPLHKGLIY